MVEVQQCSIRRIIADDCMESTLKEKEDTYYEERKAKLHSAHGNRDQPPAHPETTVASVVV